MPKVWIGIMIPHSKIIIWAFFQRKHNVLKIPKKPWDSVSQASHRISSWDKKKSSKNCLF